ncbi:MAG: alpha-L-fucosidase [Bacteroidales bacterium]|nr:alpha-L-fucosidase [Bacteroidales bacterium]
MANRHIRRIIALSLSLAAASGLMAQTEQEKWDLLNERGYPQWFSDAKLGIFVHWGLYSVPAYAGKEGYSEWLYKGLMNREPGRMKIMSLYADTSLPVREMYGQLADHWHAELWQPQEWAKMFKDAGARYVMLVTKHHDGYSLFADPFSPQWNSTVSGPRRDIVAELTKAVRQAGLRMCFYYSLPEWSNPLHRWTVDPDSTLERYVTRHMIPQFRFLVDRFRPDAIFADGDWDFTAEQLHSADLIRWYYGMVGDDAIVNDRWGKGTQHGFRTPEYSAGIADLDRPWAECRGIGRSFGLNRNEDLDNYMTDRELIQHFCELVAHGGGLTLNVGPAADGTIPMIQQERLRSLGQWLKVNGEAIYGTWPVRDMLCHRSRTTAAMPHTTAIDFDWVRNAPLKGMPVDNFEVEWTGITPTPPAEGDYILRINGDDEVWMPVGRDTLYYNHAWADNARSQTTVHMDGSSVLAMKVRYRERELEATVHVDWSRDGGKTFTPVYADWEGTASWERTVRCFTQNGDNLYVIEFERPGREMVIPSMPKLDKRAAITLLGTTATLKWRQKRDGTLVIDLTAVSAKEINALDHAWVFKISK